jgi:hypothetical protein
VAITRASKSLLAIWIAISDPAGAALDQQRLAALQTPEPDDVVPGREQHLGQRRCPCRVEALGPRHGLLPRHGAEFRISAAIGQRADLAPDEAGIHTLADCDDGPGGVEAGQVRSAGRRRIEAASLLDVGAVDADRLDLEQDLAGLGMRLGAPGLAQHLRPAGMRDFDHPHRRTLR